MLVITCNRRFPLGCNTPTPVVNILCWQVSPERVSVSVSSAGSHTEVDDSAFVAAFNRQVAFSLFLIASHPSSAFVCRHLPTMNVDLFFLPLVARSEWKVWSLAERPRQRLTLQLFRVRPT